MRYLRLTQLWASSSVGAFILLSIPLVVRAETFTQTIPAVGSRWEVATNGFEHFSIDNAPEFGYTMGTPDSHVLTAGYEFTDVTIPQGVTITSASMSGALNVSCFFNDVEGSIRLLSYDDAPEVTDYASALSALNSKTTASTSWTVTCGSSGGTDTPDFSSSVQEVVNRSGWNSRNDIIVIIEDNGAQQGDTVCLGFNSVTTITIEYTTGAVTGGSGKRAYRATRIAAMRSAFSGASAGSSNGSSSLSGGGRRSAAPSADSASTTETTLAQTELKPTGTGELTETESLTQTSTPLNEESQQQVLTQNAFSPEHSQVQVEAPEQMTIEEKRESRFENRVCERVINCFSEDESIFSIIVRKLMRRWGFGCGG